MEINGHYQLLFPFYRNQGSKISNFLSKIIELVYDIAVSQKKRSL